MTEIQKKRNIRLAEALESGKYKQAKGRLRKDDRFCCLGVACEIYRLKTRRGKWKGDSFNGADKLPPNSVVEYFGWRSAAPAWDEDENVAEKNDNGVPFKRIAKFFRRLAAGKVENT